MNIKLVAVFAENKPGQTARLTRILAESKINMRWITVASIGAFGVMKFLVSDAERACETIKQAGFIATLVDVLCVEVDDRPGALHAVADTLARHQINLDNTSGFVANNRAVVILEVHDVVRTREVLQREKFRVLSQKEMLNL